MVNWGEFIGGIVMGIISIVIISEILADTNVAASMDALTKLIVGFVPPSISVGLIWHSFQGMTQTRRPHG